MRIILIINIVLRLLLGGMLFYGGIQKFQKPIPPATEMIDKIKLGEDYAKDPDKLKIKNYIFGMKQTNYFWQFLGIAELLAGALLISQIFGFLGAVVALPMTINIFLFHLFLEFDDTGELIQTAALLLANIWLIAVAYPQWHNLLRNKIWQTT